MFYDRKIDREYTIYTWGCASDPESEGIKNIHRAIMTLRERGVDCKMLHSGINYAFGDGYEYVPPTKDLNEVARRLSQSRYANALREEEGFELMGIEGMLCGARPIYYDLPCYRHWFDDFGLFIPPGQDAVKELVKIFDPCFMNNPGIQVTPEEKYNVINTFRWRTIGDNFWAKVLQGR